MPDSALAKKMKLKPGERATIINAPAGYKKALAPLPAGVKIAKDLNGTFDWNRPGEARQSFR